MFLNQRFNIKKDTQFKISLVISTYNNPSALLSILKLLEQGSIEPHEIHIAEDGKSEDYKDIILSTGLNITHHQQEDKGFRKARILNCAVDACKGDYIVFLDGDCLPHKHFVRDHMLMAEKGYFVQGRRCFIDEDSVPQLLNRETSLSKLIISGKVSGLLKSARFPLPIIKRNSSMHGLLGCNLGAWHEDLLSVNGFDEDFEGWGREDSDLGARLYNLGLHRKMVYGRAVVYHLNHPKNSRESLNRNDEKLSETIKSKKIRCRSGIIKE
jgi:glycosyltransferase involved in cell wall biosynthesis